MRQRAAFDPGRIVAAAHKAAKRAVPQGTVTIGRNVYVLTFDYGTWKYDVQLDGAHVLTINTKKITEAKRLARASLA